MLGGMLSRVASEQGFRVAAFDRSQFDATAAGVRSQIAGLLPDAPALVVNCVAITKPGTDPESIQQLFAVNSLFPRRLAEALRSEDLMVQISTDAVFPGRENPYVESDECEPPDAYGLSKLLGEQSLPNVLNIRTSIIGPEWQQNHKHLLEWVLAHPCGENVNGFVNHIWQGVSTKQLSTLCCALSDTDYFNKIRSRTAVIHYTPNLPISKFDLVAQIAEAFEHKINVRPVEAEIGRKRLLSSLYREEMNLPSPPRQMCSALSELTAYRKAVVH